MSVFKDSCDSVSGLLLVSRAIVVVLAEGSSMLWCDTIALAVLVPPLVVELDYHTDGGHAVKCDRIHSRSTVSKDTSGSERYQMLFG